VPRLSWAVLRGSRKALKGLSDRKRVLIQNSRLCSIIRETRRPFYRSCILREI
jgi:hypothetical protein